MKEMTRTVEAVNADSRIADRIPFSEGDELTLVIKPAVGAFLWGEDDSLPG